MSDHLNILAMRTQQTSSPYGYTPTFWVCVLFLSLFFITTVIHLGQAIRYRMWWLLCTAVLAGVGEVIGWSGRLWSSKDVANVNPYFMQITTTIIAPTPLVAANFIILGRIMGLLGTQYSRLTPRRYTIVFLSCDLIALVVQAYGGATASTNGNPKSNPGPHIMLAGIVFQLVALVVYAALASEFLYRYFMDRPIRHAPSRMYRDPRGSPTVTYQQEPRGYMKENLRKMIFGLALSTLVIFIRSIYRTAELADGFNGRIIKTERYFDVLDGAMITIAMFTLNVLHPGRLLGSATAMLHDAEMLPSAPRMT